MLLSLCVACNKQPSQQNAATVMPAQVVAQHELTPPEKLVSSAPPMPSPKTQEWILSYTNIAKADWIAMECPNLITPADKDIFEKNLVRYQAAIGAIMQKEFNCDRAEIIKYVHTPLMNALDEVKANQFYGCGKEAAAILAGGMANAQDVSDQVIATTGK